MSENEEDIQGYCDFCGEKIKEDDSSYGDNEGHIFCDYPCLERFKMGNKDTCAYCDKKIYGSIIIGKDFSTGESFRFCSNDCSEKFNEKRADAHKLEFTDSCYGGNWDKKRKLS